MAQLQVSIKKHKDIMIIGDLMKELIPGYMSSSKHHREALIKAFTFKNYCGGVNLFTEGVPNTTAYLILDGEISLTKKTRGINEIPDYSRNMISLNKIEQASFRIP